MAMPHTENTLYFGADPHFTFQEVDVFCGSHQFRSVCGGFRRVRESRKNYFLRQDFLKKIRSDLLLKGKGTSKLKGGRSDGLNIAGRSSERSNSLQGKGCCTKLFSIRDYFLKKRRRRRKGKRRGRGRARRRGRKERRGRIRRRRRREKIKKGKGKEKRKERKGKKKDRKKRLLSLDKVCDNAG